MQSIIVDDEITFSSSARTCDEMFKSCTFCDENHGHIIIRDLRLTKLRSLLILNKRPNWREPNTIKNLKTNYKLKKRRFKWLESICHIRSFKKNKKPQKKQVLL